jgi:hypothetical protein
VIACIAMDARLATDELEFLITIAHLVCTAPGRRGASTDPGSKHTQAQASAFLAASALDPGKAAPAPALVASAPGEEDSRTHKKVMELLAAKGATFRTLEHAPTRTSEEVRELLQFFSVQRTCNDLCLSFSPPRSEACR